MAIQAQLYPENHGFPLCGSQDWIMDNNGCGGGGGGGSGIGYGGFNYFCFNLQQKQQLQQQQRVQQLQNQQQRNQNLFFDNMASTLKNNPNINTINNNSHQSMLYPQSIASQFEKQNQEIDHYIRIQVRKIIPLFSHRCFQIIEFLLLFPHCYWIGHLDQLGSFYLVKDCTFYNFSLILFFLWNRMRD